MHRGATCAANRDVKFFLNFTVALTQACRLGINDKPTREKFSESVWKMLFYTVSFSWGAFLAYRRDWFVSCRLLAAFRLNSFAQDLAV